MAAGATSSARAGVHIALLRGINVGGKNMLPMKDLVAFFREAGCSGVRTYIQSGNVVFSASVDIASRTRDAVRASISKRYGYSIPIVLRGAADLAKVVRDNPFVRAGADPETLHVAFLAEPPGAGRSAKLDGQRSPPDEFIVKGQTIYLRLPNGMGRTKFTNAYFDATLGTTSTMRNWRTVLTLLEWTKTATAPAEQ